MSIVTISREVGSGGDEVAHRLCEVLGYRYFDKELMTEVAVKMGISEEEVIDYSEDSYKLRSFIDNLFRRREPLATITVKGKNSSGEITHMTEVLDEERALKLIQRTIERLREIGNVVIVGRGSQVILRDAPGVLHIRIVAPVEQRIGRIMLNRSLTRNEARDYMETKDRASSEYLRRFYGVDWSDPSLYHLVINMGRWNTDEAVDIIHTALEKIQS
ncbi:MAG TPA: cytidylate kinase-like family protein [bacterium]|nr:cytidylate kinase-like family protein [bacterium]